MKVVREGLIVKRHLSKTLKEEGEKAMWMFGAGEVSCTRNKEDTHMAGMKWEKGGLQEMRREVR